MELKTWLKAETGRATALADHCGVTVAAVSQWQSAGVPMRHVRAVAEFSAHKVTVDEMVSVVMARAEGRAAPAAEARDAA